MSDHLVGYFGLSENGITDENEKGYEEQNFSFTLAFVYAVCKCANEIEAFRYRFLDGKIVLFDKIDTAFTYLNKETKLFKVVNVPMQDTMKEYVELAAQTAEEQKDCYEGIGKFYVFQKVQVNL